MRLFIFITLIVIGGFLFFKSASSKGVTVSNTIQNTMPNEASYATLAGGCFWCLESEFRALDGVLYTRVGYIGGKLQNPSYRDITTGKTGHAEAVEIFYDPKKLSYTDILDFFLRKAHDPTQLNRQGVDVGTQYRSAIFYHDEKQLLAAQEAIATIEKQAVWKQKIQTTLEPVSVFWEAEEYHQQYYEKYEMETGAPHIRVILKNQKKNK